MKTWKVPIVFGMVAIVVLTLACSAGSSVEPGVVVVTSPPIVVTATPAPVVATIEQSITDLLEGQGLYWWGADNRGENECGADRCVHFGLGSGGDGISVYIEGGQLKSILAVIDETDGGDLGAATFVLIDGYWNMTDAEMKCLMAAELGEGAQCGGFYTNSMIGDDGLLYIGTGLLAPASNTNLEA